jgi:hypothetical protein
MEKFNGWYKGAQVYLVPQGNDYLYKKAYAESGAEANTDIATYDAWKSDGKKQCVFVKFNPCEEKNADNKEKAKIAYILYGGIENSDLVSIGESGVVCLTNTKLSKDLTGVLYADTGGTKKNGSLKDLRAWEAESSAQWIEEAVKQQGKPSLAEMYGHLVERLGQLDEDVKNASGNKETAYIATLSGSATLSEVVNSVNKIINLLGANGFLSEVDTDA